MIGLFLLLFAISLITAFLSMKDMDIPKEIVRLISVRKHKGSIVFFKGKVKHYSSDSSSKTSV